MKNYLKTTEAFFFVLVILMAMETTRTYSFYIELMTAVSAIVYTGGFQLTYIFLLMNGFKKTVFVCTLIMFFISAASFYTPLTEIIKEERKRIETPTIPHAEEQNPNCPMIKTQRQTEDGKILSYEYPEKTCIENNKRIAVDNKAIDEKNAPIIEENKKLNVEIPIKFWFSLISAVIFSLVPILMGVVSNELSKRLEIHKKLGLGYDMMDKTPNGLKINNLDISKISNTIENG